MSTSILIEEVGIGAATIITEPNLTVFDQHQPFAAIYSVEPVARTNTPEDVDIPDDDTRASALADVEMDPIPTSMEAEESAESPEKMNEEADVEDSVELRVDGIALVSEDEARVLESVIPEVVETQIYTEELLFAAQTMVELSRHSWGTSEPNYLRGCVWSPDGTCILAPVHRDGMHVLELPTELYTVDRVSASRPLDVLTSAVHVPENGMVYDYCWYPFMNSGAPETCCWLSSQQHGPIQMWDAFDGKLRCSYRGYDAVDEVFGMRSFHFFLKYLSNPYSGRSCSLGCLLDRRHLGHRRISQNPSNLPH